jgi:RNA polymerase sigma factor (sigma-70 family)
MATALVARQLAPACSEQELVAAVRRGDDRAFEELYSRYRARIGAYISRMVRDHTRAEDVAQEVFISALRRLRETERAIVFKPWLYEIAKNACIDEFRRTRRTREVPLDRDRDDAEGSSGPVIAGGTTPDSAVENKQRLDDLRGAFHGLSESHHKVIVMRELAGLSYEEIGERLGMSKPMVESALFRARRKLGQEYEELVSGRRCERVRSVIEAGGERPFLSLGVRERRQLARHLSHCQPCRRHARMAGVDESFFQTPSIIGKIAALLPIPAWLRFRRTRGDGDGTGPSAPHSVASLQSMQVAARLADSSTPAYGLGRASATVAAIVVAGAGGGLITGLGGAGTLPAIHPAKPHMASPAANPPARNAHARRAGSPSVRRANRIRRTMGTGGGGGSGGGAGSAARPGASHNAGTAGAGGGASGGGASGGGASRSASGGGAPLSGAGSRVRSVVGGGSGSPAGAIQGAAGGAVSKVQGTAGGAVSKIQGTAGGALSTAGGAVSKVTQTASNVTQAASNTVSQAASNVTSTASNLTNTASNTVSQTASNVTSTASNAVGQTASNVTSTASNAVGQTASNVTSTASNVTGNVTSTASKLTNTASNAVNQTASNATRAASNAVSSLPKP